MSKIGQASRQQSYQNPVPVRFSEGEGEFPSAHPDPYVLKHNGEYYCFSTGKKGIPVLHSKDMTVWEHKGYALEITEQKNYWAPCVFYLNGKFYMYYSSMLSHQSDPHDERMKVAVADVPTGPYRYVKNLFDTFSIDPHLIRTGAGELYFFYSVNLSMGTDAERPGTAILVDKMLDPFTLEGNPKSIVKPSIDEEIFEVNRFGDGRDWHTIEGAFYLKRGAKHYVMYSGNAFTSPYYFIGCSRADDLGEGDLRALNWRKLPDDHTYLPVMMRNQAVEGVGHNSVVKAPNNVDDWIVYHGRDVAGQSVRGSERRTMRIDPLLWNGDRMWVPGPTSDPQEAPGQPYLRELFDGQPEGGAFEGEAWKVLSGSWQVVGEQLLQDDLKGVCRFVSRESFGHYLLEINLRWESEHTGGLYGALVSWHDEQNYAEVILDVGAREIFAHIVRRGISMRKTSCSQDKDFDFKAYHQLLIEKNGHTVQVSLDELLVLNFWDVEPAGKIGLVTHYTRALFDGISLTLFAALNEWTQESFAEFLAAADDASCGNWILQDGKLLHKSRNAGKVAVKGALFGKSFLFNVDVDPFGGAKECGLAVVAGSAAALVEVKWSPGGDTVECIDRSGGTDGAERKNTVALGGQTAVWPATIRVRRDRSQLTLTLNEYVIFEGDLGVGGNEPCDIQLSSHGPAQFANITVTALHE
jgi:GH43 family beta-xylosidase